jgi:hypothetical protein
VYHHVPEALPEPIGVAGLAAFAARQVLAPENALERLESSRLEQRARIEQLLEVVLHLAHESLYEIHIRQTQHKKTKHRQTTR